MEPILHTSTNKRKRNSPKVNLTIAVVVHAIMFGIGAYWAAHEGVLGKKLQDLTLILVPKEKKEEAKKEEVKTEEKKVEETSLATEPKGT